MDEGGKEGRKDWEKERVFGVAEGGRGREGGVAEGSKGRRIWRCFDEFHLSISERENMCVYSKRAPR